MTSIFVSSYDQVYWNEIVRSDGQFGDIVGLVYFVIDANCRVYANSRVYSAAISNNTQVMCPLNWVAA